MADFVAPLAAADAITIQQDDLTNDLSDISVKVQRVYRNSAEYSKAFQARKDAARMQYPAGSKELASALDEIDDEKEVVMSEIAALQDQLDTDRKTKEALLTTIQEQLKKWLGMAAENAQASGYAGGGSGK